MKFFKEIQKKQNRLKKDNDQIQELLVLFLHQIIQHSNFFKWKIKKQKVYRRLGFLCCDLNKDPRYTKISAAELSFFLNSNNKIKIVFLFLIICQHRTRQEILVFLLLYYSFRFFNEFEKMKMK